MMYKIEGEDLYLIGTSEHSMIGKFIDTINDESKLPYTLTTITILSFFCGVLMYIAVENYKNNTNGFAKQIGIFLCVTMFIVCGFEHSIADVGYYALAVNSLSMAIRACVFVTIVSAFNGIGAIASRYIIEKLI